MPRQSYVVQILQDRFDPDQLEVHLEDSVVWRNNDSSDHSATSDDGVSFDTGLIQPNHLKGKVIIHPDGAIPYHDAKSGFRGQIVVVPRA